MNNTKQTDSDVSQQQIDPNSPLSLGALFKTGVLNDLLESDSQEPDGFKVRDDIIRRASIKAGSVK